MWANHRLWAYLEKHGEVRQDQLRQLLGGDQDHWRWLSESWEHMGLVSRTPEGGSYRVRLSTRMGQVVPAKCPSCGKVSEAPKAMFLEKMTCLDCNKRVLFVLLSSGVEVDTQE
jgi:DNA-binding IclR family transcriptional regulator